MPTRTGDREIRSVSRRVGIYVIVIVVLKSLTKLCSDLDQLNHILGILGSPTKEDLQCIMNEKVHVT